MADQEVRKFYVSLIQESGNTVGHAISLTPPASEDFSATIGRVAPETKQSKHIVESKLDFQLVCSRLVSAMESYRKFIALTIQFAPVLSALVANRRVGEFVRTKGVEREDLSNEKVKVYELDVNQYREFSVHNDEVSAALQGARQLPELMVIGLVSAYDAFLSQLLRVVLNMHDEIVMTSEKTIKFSDLSKFQTIQDAREALIEREIEAAIRMSHHEQFAWMEKKFSIPLRENLSVWPRFIELCERRNLVTHTGGIVSAQYLSVCKENNVEVTDVKIGAKLSIDSKYYAEAVDTIYEVAAKLCHVLWRKFAKEERETADKELIELAFNLIYGRAYALAEALLSFGVKILKQHATEKTRCMMVVNLANAIRLQGRAAEARKMLDEEDWSVASPEFAICVAAVKEDVDEVVKFMREIGRDGKPDAEAYRSWPVFRGMRTNEKFITAFETTFGEPLLAPRPIIAPNLKNENNSVEEIEKPVSDEVGKSTAKETVH